MEVQVRHTCISEPDTCAPSTLFFKKNSLRHDVSQLHKTYCDHMFLERELLLVCVVVEATQQPFLRACLLDQSFGEKVNSDWKNPPPTNTHISWLHARVAHVPCSKQNGEGEREGERCGMGWNRLGNRKTRVGIHTLKSCVTFFKSLSLGVLFLFCRIKTTLAWKNIMEIGGAGTSTCLLLR